MLRKDKQFQFKQCEHLIAAAAATLIIVYLTFCFFHINRNVFSSFFSSYRFHSLLRNQFSSFHSSKLTIFAFIRNLLRFYVSSLFFQGLHCGIGWDKRCLDTTDTKFTRRTIISIYTSSNRISSATYMFCVPSCSVCTTDKRTGLLSSSCTYF